jgi:flavorubredoxin
MFTRFKAKFTRIDEIVPGIYKLSVSNDKKFIFSQFLILDECPILIHTGRAEWFDQIYELVSSVCDASKLRYIAFSHLEADECGSLNRWLEVAPQAETIVSRLNQSNIDDFALRPTTVLKNKKALSLGKREIILIETPHFPHGWESCVFYQPQEEILFCSDLAAHPGQFEEPVTDKDLTESIIKFQQKVGFMCEGKSFTQGIEAVEKLPIKYLATMHGSIIRGESIANLFFEMKQSFGA